ncbi:8877_t:CDS:2 [Entrophospora sp. SA101]|nr:6769_t:CDS:2 [Entrophospora sp. SA101]CAJ0882049.1 8877_t:CDS:2 [Entrophospora sp. SA101]
MHHVNSHVNRLTKIKERHSGLHASHSIPPLIDVETSRSPQKKSFSEYHGICSDMSLLDNKHDDITIGNVNELQKLYSLGSGEEKEDDNIESTTLPDILVEENTLKNINRNLTEDDVENIDGFGRFYNILQNSRRRYQIKKSTFKKLSILAI